MARGPFVVHACARGYSILSKKGKNVPYDSVPIYYHQSSTSIKLSYQSTLSTRPSFGTISGLTKKGLMMTNFVPCSTFDKKIKCNSHFVNNDNGNGHAMNEISVDLFPVNRAPAASFVFLPGVNIQAILSPPMDNPIKKNSSEDDKI